MATRYYLPISGAPLVSPALNADWANNLASPSRIAAVSAKSNTALTAALPPNTVTGKTFARQYVIGPIGVVNFNGTTFSFVAKFGSGTGCTVSLRANLRLYHTDTTFTTLLAAADFDTAIPATSATRIISAAALANVSSLNNDYIVFEVGGDITVAGASVFTPNFGDPTATADYTLTSGQTTPGDPWAEFSAAIPAPAAGGGLLALF
jgi:hypothetical protein